MSFAIFQTDTATMRKITTDGYGDESVSSSFTVDVDPDITKMQMYDIDGNVVSAKQTFISNHPSIDLTHDKWELEYNGSTYDIKELEPRHDIGTNNIDHLRVILR